MMTSVKKILIASFFILYGFLKLSFSQSPADTLVEKNTILNTQPGTDSLKSSAADTSRQLYRLNRTYLKSALNDLRYVAERPVHWQRNDWKKFSAAAVVTAGIMASDWEVRKVFQANQNNFTGSVARVVEPFGNVYGLYIFPAIYVAGVVTKQRKVESIGLQGAKSLAISTAVYTVTKKIIRRRRPDAATSQFDYALPFTRRGYTSSPSGHSNTIFTVATALALEFKDVKWVPPALYAIATATALSRVYQNRHWASDILMGSLLGHFVTKAVWRNSQPKTRKAKVLY
jgi:membrane-associated phospholipid phosphatase